MATIHFSKATFEEKVLQGKGKALVDFWAPWCGPCRMMGPIVDEMAEERTDVSVGKINVDEEQDLAAKYGVMTIPTLIVFKDGEEVKRVVGVQPKHALEKMLDEA